MSGKEIQTVKQFVEKAGGELYQKAIEKSDISLSIGDFKHFTDDLTKSLTKREKNSRELLRRFQVIDRYQQLIGYRGIEKPRASGGIPYTMLRESAKRIVLVSAIHQVIDRGIKTLCSPAVNNNGVGYDIVHKHHSDDSFQPDKDEQDVINKKRRAIREMFDSPDPVFAQTFAHFMGKCLKDHLEIDRVAIGLTYKFDVNEGREIPILFTPLDGATIKPLPEYVQQYMSRDKKRFRGKNATQKAMAELSTKHGADFTEIGWIQENKNSGGIINYFKHDEIIVGIDNPRTELGYYGHGRSYVEMATQALVAFAYSFSYNVNQFTEGVLPEGLIAIIGDFTEEGMNSLENELRAMTSKDPNHKHTAPIIALDPDQAKGSSGVQWIPLKPTNKDMLYNEWLHLVTALTTSIYGVPIHKLQMDAMTSQGKAMINHPDNMSTAIENYEYLESILSFFKSLMDNIVKRIDPDYRWQWKGLKIQDESVKLDLDIKKANFMTINEIRATHEKVTLAELIASGEDLDVIEGVKLSEVYKIVGNMLTGTGTAQINFQILQTYLNSKEPDMEEEGGMEGMEGTEGDENMEGGFDESMFTSENSGEVEKSMNKMFSVKVK